MPRYPYCAQPTYEGKKANTVYKEVIDNLYMRKFLGPFPVDTTHLRVHHVDGSTSLVPVNTMPMFVLEKPDSTPRNRKYRMLFNAAWKWPNPDEFQPTNKEKWHDFNKSKPITTFNENMVSEECSFPSI